MLQYVYQQISNLNALTWPCSGCCLRKSRRIRNKRTRRSRSRRGRSWISVVYINIIMYSSNSFSHEQNSSLICQHWALFNISALLLLRLHSYSWVSLGYFAVNLSGGQPKMYWWLCCVYTGVKKSHEIAHICWKKKGQHIQWKTISLRWLCIDLELTPREIRTSRGIQEYLRQSTRWSQKHGGRVTTPSNKSPSYLLEWSCKV